MQTAIHAQKRGPQLTSIMLISVIFPSTFVFIENKTDLPNHLLEHEGIEMKWRNAHPHPEFEN